MPDYERVMSSRRQTVNEEQEYLVLDELPFPTWLTDTHIEDNTNILDDYEAQMVRDTDTTISRIVQHHEIENLILRLERLERVLAKMLENEVDLY